jgi:pimeloyl-ACP methyl ester carboxylesterase
MKRIFTCLFVSLAVMTVFSCDRDKLKEDDVKSLRGTLVSVDEGVSYTPEQLAEFLMENKDGANADEIEKLTKIRDNFLSNVQNVKDSLERVHGTNGISYFYNIHRYTYRSEDQYGNRVTLSAMAAWPYYILPWGAYDYDPDDIMLFEHYTIGSDEEAPTNSRETQTVAIFMSHEDLVIAPDLIGYGQTRDSVHLYLNHDVTAKNSVDAIQAGIDVFNKYKTSNTELEKDWGLYVVGMSQGGASALAVQKYFDTHADEAEKFRFKAAICCSGPYSPSATIQHYIDSGKGLEFPFVIPMTTKSMRASYPELRSKYMESEFYTDEYITDAMPHIDKLFQYKESTNKEISKEIARRLHLSDDSVKISDIFNSKALDPSSQINKDMMAALKKNDLVTGWTPKHKIYLMHGRDDEVVPYINAVSVAANFGKNVMLVTSGSPSGHNSTCYAFLGLMTMYGPKTYVEKADNGEL